MKDKLIELQGKRRDKFKIYNDTQSSSWKKNLYRYQLDVIDSRIKIERLKRQNQ
jgi:hypothetical protein